MGRVLNRNLLAHYMQMGSSNYRLDIRAQSILEGMVCKALAGMVLGMVLVHMALGMVLAGMVLGMVPVRKALGMASDILLARKIVRFLSLLQMQIALTARSNP